MLDFLKISTRIRKKENIVEIYPKFVIMKSEDLMIRGGDFYAIWVEDRGLWSTDEQDALQLIDRELTRYAEDNKQRFDGQDDIILYLMLKLLGQVVMHLLWKHSNQIRL